MSDNHGWTRRRFGALAGSFVVGTAGCLGDDTGNDQSDDTTTDDTGDNTTTDDQSDDTTTDDQSGGGGADTREEAAKAVVEEFYGLAEMIESRDDLDDYIDAIAELTHSVSPIPELYRSLAESEGGELTVTVYESVETAVVDADLGSEAIQEDFFLASEVSAEDLETVAGENLVVEAVLSGGTAVLGGDAADDGDDDDTTEWLVAPENGDWSIVF